MSAELTSARIEAEAVLGQYSEVWETRGVGVVVDSEAIAAAGREIETNGSALCDEALYVLGRSLRAWVDAYEGRLGVNAEENQEQLDGYSLHFLRISETIRTEESNPITFPAEDPPAGHGCK